MTAPYIPNAAPQMVTYGTRDIRPPDTDIETDSYPQHIPKWLIFAEEGDDKPQLLGSEGRVQLLGANTFDPKKPYYNHQTAFADIANSTGNVSVYQRLFPDDMGPKANACLWIDVLETQVNIYQRNSDGSIFTDSSGRQVVIGTTAGFKIKFVKTTRTTVAEMVDFGNHGVTTGNQTDSVTGNISTRYPIAEVAAYSRGKRGNDTGFKIWAPNYSQTQSVPGRLMAETRTFPYYFALMRRPDQKSSASIVYTEMGDTRTTFTLRQGDIDPSRDKVTYVNESLLDEYRTIDTVNVAPRNGKLSAIHFYDANIELLLDLFHRSEIPFIDTMSDFTSDPEDKYLVNLFTARSSQNVPYQTVQFSLDSDSIRLSENTIIFLESGSDGTMNDTVYNTLYRREMARYLDPNDPIQDMATNPETHIWDSGLGIEAKYSMSNVLAVRKDITPCLSTYEVGTPSLTNSEEYSVAASLKARLQNYPESEIFGMPASRGVIMGNTGKLRNSGYKKRLPALAHVLLNACRKYGSSDGKWNTQVQFTGQPASLVTSLFDVDGSFVSANTRSKYWDSGLNWVQAENVREFFIPAVRTVYPYDNSIANSFPLTVIISTLTKLSYKIWRRYSGYTSLRDNEFIAAVNAMAEQSVRNAFGDEYTVSPSTQITSVDAERGFSWTLVWKVRGPASRNVMTTYIETGIFGVTKD